VTALARYAGRRAEALGLTDWVAIVDYEALRTSLLNGIVSLDVTPLTVEEIEQISWSGSRAHLENVVKQLLRAASGEVEYLVVRASGGVPVAKGGIDFAREPGAGTIWQVATHPQLEGLGLATRLMAELETRARRRGVRKVRLGVEIGNHRARRLYDHLGYAPIGESEASWEAEAQDGTRFLYTTRLTEMVKVV
jgi:ribosomal protein S18 acetylase RimI-like enzyme